MLTAALAAAVVIAQPPTRESPLATPYWTQVDGARTFNTVERLASFETRHTLSDLNPDAQRGLGPAAAWLKAELASYGVRSSIEEFDAPPSVRLPDGAKILNVVGVVPGTDPAASDRVSYVVGHYDSRNGDAMDAVGASPGANDDASGVAVVLECARLVAANPLESTVVFLCTAGEEQGLVGAHFHAKTLAAEGKYRVVHVLNNDIVGDPSPPFIGADGEPRGDAASVIRVFSEGMPRKASAEELAKIRLEGAESDSPSRQLARFAAFIARREATPVRPMLVFRQDRFLRGGDHAAFNEAGFAAVRFTVGSEDYSRQHQNVTERDGRPYGDVPEFVSAEYLKGVTQLNLATLVHLANAPAPPANARMLAKELTTDATLAWDPSPGAAGYEVVWRETTSPDWTHARDAGDATTLTLPMSKDNFYFGVRAYDADGFVSPVSFGWADRSK